MNSKVPKKNSRLVLGHFESEEQFLQWVATYHGSNVSQTCAAKIKERLAAGSDTVDVVEMLGTINRLTRKVDLAKSYRGVRFHLG